MAKMQMRGGYTDLYRVGRRRSLHELWVAVFKVMPCLAAGCFSVACLLAGTLAHSAGVERPADFTVWRPQTGYFYTRSLSGLTTARQWGAPSDIPVVGDFDGDGAKDFAVWRPSTGFWYIVQSSTGEVISHQWGAPTDVPVVGDFDGDGKADIAVWRPSTGYWYIIQSSNGEVISHQWGASTDVPVTGDFDGDGKTDVAVWRPSTGYWYIIQSSNGAVLAKQWGEATDIPVPQDYDGDGKTDVAVWRPSTGYWYVVTSHDGATIAAQWGGSSDLPANGSLEPEALMTSRASTPAIVPNVIGDTESEAAAAITASGLVVGSVTLQAGTTGNVISETPSAGSVAGSGSSVNLFVSVGSSSGSPTITMISPSTIAAGGPAFTLTVNGQNFTPASIVRWNGTNQITTYLSPTQLTVQIAAADIAAAGGATVSVVNGTAGVGTPSTLPVTLTGALPATAHFVAPSGSDSNPGTINQPYLTIQKCATMAASGSTCYLRAGTYTETVTPNSGITISSYDGETVTVDGSDAVTGWTVYQGSIYQATVTLSTGDTNQLFANGQMMTEARWPNGNDLFHVNWGTLGTGTTSALLVDSDLPDINWKGAKIHFWSGTDPADHQTGTVTSSAAGQLNLTLDGIGNPFYTVPQPGGYYYLYRLLGALDAPNEWYYDSATNTLYFWAPGGVNPNTLQVRAKQRPYAFDLSGKSNVTIEYINLFASTINSNSSSTGNTINGINAQYLSQFTDLPDNPPAGVESTDTYYTLHQWDTGIIVYGTSNVVENSVIEWSAGNGVAVAGSGNTVKNNLIDHVDYMGIDTAGVNVAGMNQEVQNNTIYATGRYAIWLNSWYYGTEAGLPNGVNVDVSYNNIYATEILSTDAGAIYTGETQGVTGSAIHHNWVHDSQALYSMVTDKNPQYPLPGVYLDQYATGWNVYQNVLWNNQVANIYLYETGVGNAADFPPQNDQIFNNSIPDVASTGYIWLAGILNCGTTQITNNLVLLPVLQNDAVIPSSCPATNNSATAPGAYQMTSSIQVGCNFSGCASDGPPAISGTSVAASIAVQPYGVSVPAGQTATFSVTGAGSAPLTYQWQKNGVNIIGASATTYTTPATVAGDSGAVFTVQVTNSLGSVASNAAVLTVN